MKVLIVDGLEWGTDYDSVPYPNCVGQWFIDAFGGDPSRFDIWRAQKEDAPPAHRYHGIVIGGSHSSVYDGDPWIRRLEEHTRRWIGEGVPLLGVCFGHQLIAQAAGGRVERNPKGWELGTRTIELTAAGQNDPMFAGLPATFQAMQSHQDMVVELPQKAECLATSDACAVQAFRIGDNVRTLQFHPEFTPNHMRYIISPCQPSLREQGADCDTILAELKETPLSRRLFSQFERAIIQGNHPS